MRILVIEDDLHLNKAIINNLSDYGYQTDNSENFKDGEYFIGIRHYDLVLISWNLSDGDGSELINTIKHKSPRTAVLIMSSKTDKETEIEMLRLGADDFIKKPIDFDILLARIEARLRMGGTNIIKIEDLIIDPDEEKITYKGQEIELKGKPFEVLTHLARHSDQIVSKEQLLDAIWEEPELVTPNVIEVAINQIRQKMDKPLNISTIETVRRRGYRFCFPKKA
ncbi:MULTISPECIES: homeostatic response regulator transcription factor HsrA [unclassified Campylobacter]|uniref:homeostatic response regulator transcription factor HsrA n=1 Tax=unclassified Campylobacter TaxID=2593542 RepID=UPI001237E03D|nr:MULTISPECIES: homeostatic response regulator transcription factor HsrA [unclassified Campylobacter]KAA6227128.1 homeostatic response regulator transcription factor HsrA [Campylobacter sp. LR185c]KAA6227475.1 homeostatic response regulator transcription factor HsrA [Campylobacter sp. LR196d]KAA6228501.1 homeostatic response regulator transcription factor HsrA [Campylobacter sp. LR286c]KAA6230892.1 homeostatic response regulator transcription factor HsrA [Campylobacter sp. LR291e]KAA6233526.1